MTLQDLKKFEYVQVRKPSKYDGYIAQLEFGFNTAVGFGQNPYEALEDAYKSFITNLENPSNESNKKAFYNV